MKANISVSNIARPIGRMPFTNNPTLYLPDKRLLAAVCLASSEHDLGLYLINVDNLTDTKVVLPEGERGTYGFVHASDGNLYMGTFTGKIYCFDFEIEKLREVAHPFSNTDTLGIWGGGADSAGRVYMGTYPTGQFCQYDTASSSWEIFSPMDSDKKGLYASEFLQLPDGRMLVLIQGAEPTLFIHNPSTGNYEILTSWSSRESVFSRLECFFDDHRVVMNTSGKLKLFDWQKQRFDGTLLDEMPEADIHVSRIGDSFYGTALSGRFYHIENRQSHLLAESPFPPDDNPNGQFHQIEPDEWVVLGKTGMFVRLNVKTGRKRSFRVQNESNTGLRIQMLEYVPQIDRVVGSHFICMQMFNVNLKTNECESSLRKISHYSGQVNCGTYVNDTFYAGSYGKAVLYAYEPQQPFAYGSNPRIICEIGHGQNRPITMHNDGRYVYVTTKAKYGTLGGAITVFDPKTEQIEVYRNFVPEHNPGFSSFYHSPTKLLVGVTETCGDCSTSKPTAEAAVVFLWDTQTRKVVYTAAPWSAESLNAVALSPAGKLIGFDKQRYYIFDVNSRQFQVRDWTLSPVGRYGAFGNDRFFYGSIKEGIFQLDTVDGKVEMVLEADRVGPMARMSETELLFTQAGDVRLIRVMLE